MKTEWKKYFKLAVAVFLLFLCIYYWKPFTQAAGVAFKAAAPLLLGCAIAYILNILMSFYERHYFPKSKKAAVRKSARPVCMLGAFLTLILIMAIIIRLIVPELIACIQLLFAEVPKAMKSLSDLLAESSILPENIVESLRGIDWNSTLTKILDILTSGIGNTVNFAMSAVSSMTSFVMNLVIGAIFAIYLLFGKERLQAQCNRVLANYFRPEWNEKLHHILSVTNGCFHRYIVGQCTEAVILGVLCAVGMLIFGFPYAMMTGAVIGVTALIPVAGAYIGGAVGFLLILSVSPMKAVLFVVYLVVLQQLEGNLIYPRVVGSSIGLPGIWVLATVTIGGGMFGISGMLFGVPLAAALYQLLRNNMNKKEKGIQINRNNSPDALAMNSTDQIGV